MTLSISIQDFRGVAGLTAEASGVLLLAGHNAAGKTSACAAIAAAASGDLLPFEGVTKAKAGVLVRDGGKAASASVTVTRQDGSTGGALATWPSVSRTVTGQWRDVSAVAAGVTDPLAMKPAERAAWLTDLLGASPSQPSFTAHLAAEHVPPDTIAAVWKIVADQGWDGALAAVKEGGAKLKGQWERLTRESYGSAKGGSWRPAGWSSGIDAFSVEDLEHRAATATEHYQAARRDGLKNEAARQQAKDAIERAEKARQGYGAAETRLRQASRAEDDAQRGLEEMGVGVRAIWKCPCCGEQLALIGDALMQAPERTASPKEIAQAQEWLRQATAEKESANGALDNHRLALAAGEEAKAVLARVGDAPDADGLAKLQTAAEEATAQAKMKRDSLDAASLHDRIGHAAVVARALAPGGLRQLELHARLADLNGQLAALCNQGGWSSVFVDPDMAVSFNGRPVSLCSASERFRARLTLQLAAAIAENATLVVIDGADILDRVGRNGLFGLLRRSGIEAVVGMTLLRRDDLPDLAKAKIGNSVWLEGVAP